jgi:DNA modification methylase
VGVLIHCGDCRAIMRTLPTDSIPSVVTDSPYHLYTMHNPNGTPKSRKDGPFKRLGRGFMDQEWDGGDITFRPDTWAEVYRVMKPGAHIAAFGAPRTFHRMMVAIEDAGFEIRDTLMWLYGQGFSKKQERRLSHRQAPRPSESRSSYSNGEQPAGRPKWCPVGG